ncbi:pirin-like bicupin family protein [Paenibacillus sp. JCM 10914]|uniref:pirin family protein n=1 Tax=Paenibacillus sp. JCM 10914 TaxID=1236974 RepID=UPI0003CC73F8|nr:pirin family protein [Paenibacillus sp. JCM 10914]GAE09415.1 YhhW family protein [Paenibacillus sp. JCM 10914]
MIKIMTAAERHTTHEDGIHSEYNFSFGDYEDPHNEHFGSLLAHNEYVLKPTEGFERKLHHDLVIVHLVLEGSLLYEDDTGKHLELTPGSIHVVNTGSGVHHSEHNSSTTSDTRYIEMWFLPTEPGLTPSHHRSDFTSEQQRNQLFPVIGSGHGVRSLPKSLDVVMYSSLLEKGKELNYRLEEDRRMHVYVVNGHLQIEAEDGTFDIAPGDSARIKRRQNLTLRGNSNEVATQLIVVEMP